MECPSCKLRYNSLERTPRILKCGHSICYQCIPKHDLCLICEENITNQSKINYSLLDLVEKQSTKIDKFMKVCFVGSSGVGKTSLIRMLTGNDFSQDISSTVGYDFTFIDRFIEGFTVRFQLWDSAGQQRYRAISPIHYKNANIVMVVYDISCQPIKNRIGYWLEETQKHCPKDVEVMMIGNKMDLAEEKFYNRIEKDLQQKINVKDICFHELSCKTGKGRNKLWKILEDYFVRRKNFSPQKQIKLKEKRKKLKEVDHKDLFLKKKKNQNEGCC